MRVRKLACVCVCACINWANRWVQLGFKNHNENIVFKDGIGVKGLRFKLYGNHYGN